MSFWGLLIYIFSYIRAPLLILLFIYLTLILFFKSPYDVHVAGIIFVF